MFPVSRLHFLRRGIKYQFAEQKCYHSGYCKRLRDFKSKNVENLASVLLLI